VTREPEGLAAVPAVILVGGVGSRLRSVTGDLPKPMAPVAGRPFLEHLLIFLRDQGVRRVVLCVGHGADAIRAHFETGRALGLEIEYTVEKEPRGTGGAIKLGLEAAGAPTCFVLNGDSYVQIYLREMLAAHRLAGGWVILALARVTDTARFGAVEMDRTTHQIWTFGEKARGGPGLISAGVYLMDSDVASAIPQGMVSIEKDVLPTMVARGVYGFVTDGLFIDIGVPEDYRRLAAEPEAFLSAVYHGAGRG
jgi:D-glycero-alpha-D-manno-heptose 1-phosphate guanylyltransferase